jgi:glycosyltransferase involved in cell wall biosynthesis
MRIGIVLAAVPGYSETFFRSKIQFLQESDGMEVILFADNKLEGISLSECPVVYAPMISNKRFFGGLEFIMQVAKACFIHPIKSLRLLKINQMSGFRILDNLKSLVKSVHILRHELDWIHFGFGTMAIGRENLARVIGAKMAISFRGFDHYIYPLKHVGCYSLVFKVTDQFHLLSHGMKRTLIAHGVDELRISVITPAINHKKFIPNHVKDNVDKKLSIATVARLHWIKGLEYTLEALFLLKEKGIDFSYKLIGEGEERERLIFAVHQLGLQQQVTFTGRLAPDEVVKALDEADLYLQYSIQEGFCNAVLEAQAMGLLCVVSDAEGLSENVIHEQTGWVVPKRRPVLLAQQIEDILSINNQLLCEIKNNAMKRVGEQFNLTKQKEAFISFYKS